MNHFDRTLFYLAHALVAGTGLAYALFHYAVRPVDPYALVHPWQPLTQHAHVWAAPVLVFTFGHFFYHHAWAGWRSGLQERRRSGVAMLFTGLPMILSGYLIQTAVEPAWRTAWVVTHLATSGIWLAGALAHRLARPKP